MVNTKVDLCGVTLDNPVMAASGTSDTGMSSRSYSI